MKKYITTILLLTMICLLFGCKNNVQSITLDKKRIEINCGDTFELTATILPSNVTNKEIAWSVDGNAVIASNDENSTKKEFVGKKVGEATIKVVASNGKCAECNVNVVTNSEISDEKGEENNINLEENNQSNINGDENPKTDTEYLIDGNVKVKLQNTIPTTIKQYSSIDGSVMRTYTITKVYADNKGIYVSGTKTSDVFGNEFGCKIKWQLYDENNAVVTSDWTLSPATAVGESWANINVRFNSGSLPAGVYTLQFCDSD